MDKKGKKLYVTFDVWDDFYKKRLAVECDNIDEAERVAYDCESLHGTGNIRLRTCWKPTGIQVLSFEDYFNYTVWW